MCVCECMFNGVLTVLTFLPTNSPRPDFCISYGVLGEHGYEHGYRHHVTLAYALQAAPPGLADALAAKIQEIVAKHPQISLDPPRLCYFNDMTAFVPV